MYRNERNILHQETRIRRCRRRLKAVLSTIPYSRGKIVGICTYIAGVILLYAVAVRWFPEQPDWLAHALTDIARVSIVIWGILGFVVLLLVMGTPPGSIAAYNDLQRAGLTNSAGEAPILVAKFKDENDESISILEFEGSGIPRSQWEDLQLEIEAALNCYVVRIDEGHNLRHVRLYTVPASGALPEKAEWKHEYLQQKNAVVVLGKGLAGQITVDLSKVPHILIGGSTGSGKTILLKCILMQMVQKGAEVVIADFKGGADYGPFWNQHCRMCYSQTLLIRLLEELLEELERRKHLLRLAAAANIDVYSTKTGLSLKRIVVACDEVAELLDKTGLDKASKASVLQIESALSTVARQGRAFGIHLVLATQRPDANILSGQIKNNIDCRICGRADNVLSQIILDCADAADTIPKSTQGRFLMYDGTIFQAYWFDESQMEGGV